MGRPVITAVMLEELRRQGADLRLAKDAIITPAARDWLKEHAVPVTWEESAGSDSAGSLAAVMNPALPELRAMRTMLDRVGGLKEVLEPPPGPIGLASATGRLCTMISRREVARGVVFAQDGALPVCIANKYAGIRAALGVNVPMVEEACRQLGINVLVIEYPRQTTYQVKQMIDRLKTAPAAASAETAAVIAALEQGGGHADR